MLQSYYPYGQSILLSIPKPRCKDCNIECKNVDIRDEFGHFIKFDPDNFDIKKIVYLCDNCAAIRQETVITPCMKL